MTLSEPISVLSARLADHVGQDAIAVMTTMTRTAQAAVVIALDRSDWRERHSRYSPTMGSGIAPDTGKNLSYTPRGAFSTSGSAQPHIVDGSQARSRSAFDAPMMLVATMNSPLATVFSNL